MKHYRDKLPTLILGYLERKRAITTGDVQTLFGASNKAACMALTRLADQGLVRRAEKRRSIQIWEAVE